MDHGSLYDPVGKTDLGSGHECECFLEDVGRACAGVEEAAWEGPFDRSRARNFVWSQSPLLHCSNSSFGGGVVGVVFRLGEVVRVLRTGRFVTTMLAFLLLGEGGILASLSAFFFWVLGILLLSLEFGDTGLYLLVFAMMEIGTSGVRAASEVDGYRCFIFYPNQIHQASRLEYGLVEYYGAKSD